MIIIEIVFTQRNKRAYLKFGKSILNEQELILTPNSIFRLIRNHLNIRYGIVYECDLTS